MRRPCTDTSHGSTAPARPDILARSTEQVKSAVKTDAPNPAVFGGRRGPEKRKLLPRFGPHRPEALPEQPHLRASATNTR